jgi:pyridoxamine 5'-phosphate oxidase
MNLTGKPLIRLRHHTQVLATSVRHNTTMATTSSTQSAAPWRSQFLEHVGKMESPEFVLSTVARPHNSSFSAEPRARYCIFRGMWASLPPNKHNDADKNPEVYESDCLTFTTDVRMEKANHFFESESSDETATGGGAPVEAVWWVKEKDIMTQWRVRGDAWILGPDVEDGRKKGPKTVKEAIQPRMRVLNETQKDDWKWGTEVTAHFGNLSPGMRGMLIVKIVHRRKLMDL